LSQGAPMTETEWLETSDPDSMLEFLCRRPGRSGFLSWLLGWRRHDATGEDVNPGQERKLRLFGCELCRRLESVYPDANCRHAIEVAERYADGLADEAELSRARVGVENGVERWRSPYRPYHGGPDRARMLTWQATAACTALKAPQFAVALVTEAAREMVLSGLAERAVALAGAGAQTSLLRELFGNPFRAAFLDPLWLTWNGGTVRSLAQVCYDERAFDCLPVLADALEDASCTDATILEHCRGPEPHVRGCWVVDLLLGKS
jgi:hypothetical protein